MDSPMVEIEPRIETKEAKIAGHLADIDPVLVPFAERLSKPPYKDLSNAEAFKRGRDQLEPSDLMAVHLTDTFPENGVIHPTAYYNPGILRFTTHFTVNSVAETIPIWGTSWEQKKYAILIPLDKIKGKIASFHPNETFLLEDLVLPEGAVILKDKNDETPTPLTGRAKIAEADFSQPGERLNGFHKAVYEQMIQEGFFPMRSIQAGAGWNHPGWGDAAIEVMQDFGRRNNMEFSVGLHAEHWTGALEDISVGLMLAKEENDRARFNQIAEQAKEFIEKDTILYGQEVPQKYKTSLIELIKDNQQFFDAEVEFPDLPLDEAEQKARAKIVDLSKDREHLLHGTSVEYLPLIFREGIISHDFAKKVFGHSVPVGVGPGAQEQIDRWTDIPGLDFISTTDPRLIEGGNGNILNIVQYGTKAFIPFDLILLISGRIVETNKPMKRGKGMAYDVMTPAERLIRRRIPAREFEGVIIRTKEGDYPYAQRPASKLAEDMLLRGSASWVNYALRDSRDRTNASRQRYLEKPFGSEELDTLRDDYLQADKRLQDLYDKIAEWLGYNPKQRGGWKPLVEFVPRQLLPYEQRYVLLETKTFQTLTVDKTEADLQDGKEYVDSIKNNIKELEEKGEEVGFTEVARLMGIEEQYLPKPRQVGRSIVERLKQKPPIIEPAIYPASVEGMVVALDEIITLREKRMQLNKAIWPRYVELVSGKRLEQATYEDFIIGLCKQKGLPVYNKKGEVLWPQLK